MQTSMGTTECLKLGNNSFQQGEQVTLKAIAEPGYSFHKWGGASTNTSSTCNIAIDSNSHINAYFKKPQQLMLTFTTETKLTGALPVMKGLFLI